MRRPLFAFLIIVAGLFGLLLITGLVASSLVSGSGTHGLAAALQNSLGVPVSVGTARFDLAQWFLLRPAITLDNVSIGNPPGFRSPHLLEAKQLSAQVALMPLLRKTIQVHSIVIDHPRIVAETNAQGMGNIEALLRQEKSKSGSASEGTMSGGLEVDQFSVKSGEIAFLDKSTRPGENLDISGIDLQVRDYSRDRPFRVEFGAVFFHGNNSRLHLTGQAGPSTANSLPLEGTLTTTIAPDEIPAALRRSQFGKLLGAPGKKARASLEVNIKGDAYQKLAGPAKLVLSDVLIGKDEGHVLPLGGDAPLTFAASKLMSSPIFQLNIAHAQLRLGKGEWSGDAEIQSQSTGISGRSSGKIRNVDINELVSSLTTANEKIFGLLELPYSLQFAGKNAEEIRNALHGSGKLSVTQGRIAALDLLGSIQQVAQNPQQAIAGKKGATPFTTLTANLNVGQARIMVDALQLDSPALRVTGKGTINFDQAINFELIAHVTGSLAQLLTRVGASPSAGGADLPLVVTGTVESPQVRPSVSKMVTNVAKGLLDSFLKKKTK